MKSIVEALLDLQDKYHRYPLRRCYSLHTCAVCEEAITSGETYYDGGYRRRAHESCVDFEVVS